MPKLNAEAKLFGIDLKHLGSELRHVWGKVAAALRVDRCLPLSVVRVVSAKSSGYAKVRGVQWISSVRGGREAPSSVSAPTDAKLPTVFLLNDQYFLQRELMFPAMPAAALDAAVQLQLQAASPFDVAEALWAYRIEGGHDASVQGSAAQLQVTLLITSTTLVEKALGAEGIQDASTLEVWADVPQQSPILIAGFAEGRRLKQEKRKKQWLGMGAACVLVLLALVAVTPALQLRLRAMDAHQQLQSLAARTQEQVQQRQSLLSAIQTLEEFSKKEREQINHVLLLQKLTETLPDDVALQSLSVNGKQLSLQGISDNASAVVELLGSTPGFKDVRLPSAVTRIPKLSKENFTLAAEIDTTVFGLRSQDPAKEQP